MRSTITYIICIIYLRYDRCDCVFDLCVFSYFAYYTHTIYVIYIHLAARSQNPWNTKRDPDVIFSERAICEKKKSRVEMTFPVLGNAWNIIIYYIPLNCLIDKRMCYDTRARVSEETKKLIYIYILTYIPTCVQRIRRVNNNIISLHIIILKNPKHIIRVTFTYCA